MKFLKTFQNSLQIYEKTFDNYILPSKLDEELDEEVVYAISTTHMFGEPVLFENFDIKFLLSMEDERESIKDGDWVLMVHGHEERNVSVCLFKIKTIYSPHTDPELGRSYTHVEGNGSPIKIYYEVDGSSMVVKYSSYINQLAGVPDIMKQVNENIFSKPKLKFDYILPSKLDIELDKNVSYSVNNPKRTKGMTDIEIRNFDERLLRTIDERDRIEVGDWVFVYGDDHEFIYLFKVDSFEYTHTDGEMEIIRGKKIDDDAHINIDYERFDNPAVKYSTYINKLAGIPDIMKTINEENKWILPSKIDDELDGDNVYDLIPYRRDNMSNDILPDIDEDKLSKMKDERDTIKLGDWIMVTYFDGDYETVLFKVKDVDGELCGVDGMLIYGLENAHHIIKYSTYINELAGVPDIMKTINEEITWNNYLSSSQLDRELDPNIFYHINTDEERKDPNRHRNLQIPNFDLEFFKTLSNERHLMKRGDWVLTLYRDIDQWNNLHEIMILSKIKKSKDGMLGVSNGMGIIEIPGGFNVIRYSSFISQLAGVPNIMKDINEEVHIDIDFIPTSKLDEELNSDRAYLIEEMNSQIHKSIQTGMFEDAYVILFKQFNMEFLTKTKDERDSVKIGDWVLGTYFEGGYYTYLFKVQEKNSSGEIGMSNGSIYYSMEAAFHVITYSNYINQMAGTYDVLKTINERKIKPVFGKPVKYSNVFDRYFSSGELDTELDTNIIYHINKEGDYKQPEHETLHIPGFDMNFVLSLPNEKDIVKRGEWVITVYVDEENRFRTGTSLFKIQRDPADMALFNLPLHVVRYSSYISQLAGVPNIMKDINENVKSYNKMKSYVDHTLGRIDGGEEYFDTIDKVIKDPNNLDIIKDVFSEIKKDFDEFNIILTGGFGDRIKYLIDKNVLSVSGNIVQIGGALRTKYGNKVDVIYKKHKMDNQDFILFDDSYYSGSTKQKIDDYLKDFNSKIVQTYVVYDGSREKQKGLKHIYRYRDHHQGTVLPVEKLIELIDKQGMPKEEMYKKVLSGEIKTYDQLVKYVKKFNKNIQSLNFREERDMK